MKKTIKSIAAVSLCLCIVLSGSITGFAAGSSSKAASSKIVSYNSIADYIAQSKAAGKSVTVVGGTAGTTAAATKSVSEIKIGSTTFGNIFVKAVNAVSDFLINKVILGPFTSAMPMTKNVQDYAKFNLNNYKNFYKGTATFADTAAQGAQWSLGYSEKSILPADFGTRPYVRGSMVPYASTTQTYDDLRVRTVILDDGSGRGKVVFAAIDCIGLANADVRKIRAAVADFAAANNIVSINVSATHTHTGIDSQGVWNDPLGTLANNILSATTGLVPVKSGVDKTFLDNLVAQAAASIKEACNNMAKGSLTYAVKNISDYVHGRTVPYTVDNRLYRLEFTPDSKTVKPTIIASFGCHPETTSYTFSTISADFIYYMEQVVNNAGFNFIFIQGNVSTATSSRDLTNDGLQLDDHQCAVRYGYEMGYITLGLTLTKEQCAALNVQCGDLLGVKTLAGNEGYSIWYAGWVPVTQQQVTPVLNIRLEQFLLKSDSNVSNVLEKISLANNIFIYDKSTKSYYSVTEIGYMEIGKALKVYLSPGETNTDLLVGGSGLNGFKYDCLRKTYGDNLIIFDLMNDAIGYVYPDPNYEMVGYQYDAVSDTYQSDSWCFLVSFGKNTASTIIGNFHNLVSSVR